MDERKVVAQLNHVHLLLKRTLLSRSSSASAVWWVSSAEASAEARLVLLEPS